MDCFFQFQNVDMETFVFSTVSESNSMHLHNNLQNLELRLEGGESFVEKYLTISIVSNNGFPSDYMVLESITTTDLGITQN